MKTYICQVPEFDTFENLFLVFGIYIKNKKVLWRTRGGLIYKTKIVYEDPILNGLANLWIELETPKAILARYSLQMHKGQVHSFTLEHIMRKDEIEQLFLRYHAANDELRSYYQLLPKTDADERSLYNKFRYRTLVLNPFRYYDLEEEEDGGCFEEFTPRVELCTVKNIWESYCVNCEHVEKFSKFDEFQHG